MYQLIGMHLSHRGGKRALKLASPCSPPSNPFGEDIRTLLRRSLQQSVSAWQCCLHHKCSRQQTTSGLNIASTFSPTFIIWVYSIFLFTMGAQKWLPLWPGIQKTSKCGILTLFCWAVAEENRAKWHRSPSRWQPHLQACLPKALWPTFQPLQRPAIHNSWLEACIDRGQQSEVLPLMNHKD
jgi:hypothetical protein